MNNYYVYLVETKIEYTKHIINILTPLLFEGIFSIYSNAEKISNKNDILINFQKLLKEIPNWNKNIINNETNRIINKSNKGSIIEDLIKAIIKSNLMILTNTPPEKKNKMNIKHNITTDYFIHNIYIEIARNIYNNPFLFHNASNNMEIKKNQRDILNIINDSIKNAIRNILPLNYILKEYIGESFDNNIDFDNDESESLKI